MKKNIKKGFTLVELVIVIAVIAILAGVTIPTFMAIINNSRRNSAYQRANAEYLLYRTANENEDGTNKKLAKHVLIRVKFEDNNYFFVAMNNASSVDEEPKLEDTLLFVANNKNNIIGYSTEKDSSKRNDENTYKIKGGDISKGLPGQLDSVKMYELKLESDPDEPKDSDDPDDTSVIPPVIPPDADIGDMIEFGSYPQTDVTTAMGSSLNSKAGINSGTLPSEGKETRATSNGYYWTSYKYYDKGKRANYAWYIDVEYKGDKYRGVYFVKYRPCYTDVIALGGTDGSFEYQDDNGYMVSDGNKDINIYWFKYEPIKWTITAKDGDYYTIMACNILDAQAYQTSLDDTETYTGIIVSNDGSVPTTPSDYNIVPLKYVSGTNIFANNWQASEIKQWLGVKDNSGKWSEGTFAMTAFSSDELDLIQNTTLTRNGGWDYYKGDYSTWGFIGSTGYYYEKNSDGNYVKIEEKEGTERTFSTRDITYSDPQNCGNDVPLGNKALENNYIWLPSYQELTGYKYDYYNQDGTWNSGYKPDQMLQQPENAATPVTDYAAAQGAYRASNGNGTYWLRTSSGRNTIRINFVGYDGTIGYRDLDLRSGVGSNCDDVNAAYYGIRPVTCIKNK